MCRCFQCFRKEFFPNEPLLPFNISSHTHLACWHILSDRSIQSIMRWNCEHSVGSAVSLRVICQNKRKVNVIYWSHIQLTMKYGLVHSWGAEGSHSAVPWTDSRSLPVPQSRVLTGDRPNINVFDAGGNWSTWRKPTQTRGEHANST